MKRVVESTFADFYSGNKIIPAETYEHCEAQLCL